MERLLAIGLNARVVKRISSFVRNVSEVIVIALTPVVVRRDGLRYGALIAVIAEQFTVAASIDSARTATEKENLHSKR